jgi:PPOX class probable F420-dependent enzyme
MPKQGDLSLLDNPVAQELLASTHLARLAYVGDDGDPRVVPVWFHWDGRELVIAGPPNAPKVATLGPTAKVAVSIDSETWPYHALTLRGTATTTIVDGLPTEYVSAARRYMGDEGGNAWVENVRHMSPQSARTAIRPEWVCVLDFETRWPSAIEEAMAAGAATS